VDGDERATDIDERAAPPPDVLAQGHHGKHAHFADGDEGRLHESSDDVPERESFVLPLEECRGANRLHKHE
jgi:hypothetical protein